MYKDRIFRVLFNREPDYFAQYTNGNWYETQKPTDSEAFQGVLSESELLFRGHNVANDDFVSWIKSVGYDVISVIVNYLVKSDTAERVINFFFFAMIMGDDLTSGELYNYMIGDQIETALGNTKISFVLEILDEIGNMGLAVDVATLVGRLFSSNKPTHYKDLTYYYSDNSYYDLVYISQNGQTIKIKDIANELNKI